VAGIIFLGAPFQGCNAATYGKWLAQLGRLDTALIGSLEKDSPSLHALSSDFWESYNDWDIVCFYENRSILVLRIGSPTLIEDGPAYCQM
jgi:hypothetical protein